MPQHEWRVVQKKFRPKKICSIWMITRINNKKKQMAYFKIPKTGEVYLANELISYRLAKLLHLNVAKTQLAKIQGKQGVISFVQPGRGHHTWKQLNKKLNNQIIKYIVNPKLLLKTFVFDIWICNLDRHGENLITFPIGNKYSFYLFDHNLALFGAINLRKVPWNSAYWNHVAKYNEHYVEGLTYYIVSYRQLSPFVKQVH
jgi:hypothetical protein